MKQSKKAFCLVAVGLILLLFGLVLHAFNQHSSNTDIVLNYKQVGIPSENKIAVSNGKKFGYYNMSTKRVKINYPILDSMKVDNQIDLNNFIYTDNYAPYTEKGKLGIIDQNNNIIMKAQYDKLQIVNKNTVIVAKKDSYNIVDTKNKKLLPTGYLEIIQIPETQLLILISENNQQIYNSKTNKVIVKNGIDISYVKETTTTQYIISIKTPQETIENYYYNEQENTWKKLDQVVNVTPLEVQDNQAVFGTDLKPTIIYNLKTNDVFNIKGDYAGVGTFHSALALVVNNKLENGYINKEETLVIPFIYKEGTTGFNEAGLAIANNGENYGVINTKNELIIPFQYKGIESITKDKFIAVNNKLKMIVINDKNQQLTTDEYDHIEKTKINELLIVKQGNTTKPLAGLISTEGKEITKVRYQNIQVEKGYIIFQENSNTYRICSSKNIITTNKN